MGVLGVQFLRTCVLRVKVNVSRRILLPIEQIRACINVTGTPPLSLARSRPVSRARSLSVVSSLSRLLAHDLYACVYIYACMCVCVCVCWDPSMERGDRDNTHTVGGGYTYHNTGSCYVWRITCCKHTLRGSTQPP